VNIHNVIMWLNAGMEMPAPMVSVILNNAFFHSSPRISQMLHQILHILHFYTLDSLLNYAPDFAINWWPEILKFIGVTTISEIIALLEWRQRMMHKVFR